MRQAINIALAGLLLALTSSSLRAAEPDPTKQIAKVIHIEFPKDGYTFTVAEAAKGIKFEYKIVVDRDLEMTPLPFGPSNAQPAGPAKLHPRERIHNDKHSYVLDDYGLAPAPPRGELKTIKKGSYAHTFEWDGRNWNGPSDTNTPKGKPFPSGEYDIEVSIHGSWKSPTGTEDYLLKGKTKLTLKPYAIGKAVTATRESGA